VNEALVKDLLRFSLAATATRQDEFRMRELGPIHLLKYLYLADWAYARSHDGQSITGIDWIFYDFGPFASAALALILTFVPSLDVQSRNFIGVDEIERTKWCFQRDSETEDLFIKLEEVIPKEASSAIMHAARDFGGATYPLLDMVYKTLPMRNSTPNQKIDFAKAIETFPEWGIIQPSPEIPDIIKIEATSALSNTKQKKIEQKKAILRARMKRAIELVDAQPGMEIKPIYDELFYEGTAAMDAQIGEVIGEREGTFTFDQSVWESDLRRISGVL